MNNNNPNWGLPENFRLSDEIFDGENFSNLLVLVLRRLDGAFPEPVDLSTCMRIEEHRDEFTELWSWLRAQGLVVGDLSNCTLTLSGRQAYAAALRELPVIAASLSQTQDGLEPESASRLLLATLRIHFSDFGHQSGAVT